MARIAGRRGALYAGLASSTAAAEPVAFLKEWSLDQSVDQLDVTAFQDTTKTYLTGLPDAKGTYSGFYDSASAQLYTAALGGFASRTYLYPDTAAPGVYWFGTANYDMSVDTKVDGAVEVTGSFSAATPFAKNG